MRNYLLWLRYDGTGFHGWQLQEGERSVQGELETALLRVLGPGFRVCSSSRTDAGVHALRHPVNVHAERAIPASGLLKGLNSMLPRDLSVVDAREVLPGFAARRMSCAKTYRYRLFIQPCPDPFRDPFAWRLRRPLDLPAMRRAAACLLGEHDFTSFRASQCDAKTTRRLVHAVIIEDARDEVAITICANAFLRNMVRIIVGSLVEVGSGRHGPEWMREVLAARDRTRAGRTAPPHGLCLVDVTYPVELLAQGAGGW